MQQPWVGTVRASLPLIESSQGTSSTTAPLHLSITPASTVIVSVAPTYTFEPTGVITHHFLKSSFEQKHFQEIRQLRDSELHVTKTILESFQTVSWQPGS